MQLLLLSLLLSPLYSFADVASDKAACFGTTASTNDRLSACTRLIDDTSFPERGLAFFHRGSIYLNKEENQKSIDDFTNAIQLIPDYSPAYSNRAFVYNRMKNYTAALADMEYAIQKDPNNFWNFYFLGRIYVALKDDAKAIDAFTRSIAVKKDYCPALTNRGTLLRKAQRFEESVVDYSACIQASPFEIAAYLGRGMSYDGWKKFDLSARDYKIVNLLNENYDYATTRLGELIQREENPNLPEMNFSSPAKNLKVRYLRILLPMDTRDEMERAIGDLISWFKPRPQIIPEAKAFASMTILDNRQDLSHVKLDVEIAQNFPQVPGEASAMLFRSMLPASMQAGPSMPEIMVKFDPAKLLSFWPLKSGNASTGAGEFLLNCPPFENEATRRIGCIPGRQLNFGKFDFNLFVEKVEHIHVPAGLFKAFVVRFRQKGYIEFQGNRLKRELENKYWIVPELGWWVRKTSQLGDKMDIFEATDITRQ